VSISEGTLSTTQLSQGQRKRLALLTAYLEDRPIYVFDEWAADQDPTFKRIFYEQLLPDLKHRGKAVLVITHDDRYFPLADRIVRLENGQLLQDEALSELFAPPADTRATP
jgi:putative ATP-binding cassette transporter